MTLALFVVINGSVATLAVAGDNLFKWLVIAESNLILEHGFGVYGGNPH